MRLLMTVAAVAAIASIPLSLSAQWPPYQSPAAPKLPNGQLTWPGSPRRPMASLTFPASG